MPNSKSDIFANQYPLVPPRLLNPSLTNRGAVYFTKATNTKLAADPNGILYPVMRLPSHGRIIMVWLSNPTLAGMSSLDLGLYPATDWTDAAMANPTALDQDIYARTISMVAARDQEIHNDTAGAVEGSVGSRGNILGNVAGGGAIAGPNWARQVWQDALLVATPAAVEPRPGTEYDLVWTGTTVTGAATGTFVTGVLYVMGA